MDKKLAESSLPIRLIIRSNNLEVSTEGKISDIYRELDVITQLATELSQRLALTLPKAPETALPEETAQPTEGIPSITASRSTIENLQLLFNTPWGRSARTLAEVCKALEVNAVPDREGSVSRDLGRLVKRGFLRRIEKEGKYVYYRVPQAEHS